MTTADSVLDDRISIRELFKASGPRILAALRFVASRLLYAAVTLLLIIFLSFFGLEMARGAGFSPALGHGLTSTVDYIGRLVQGDLGTAYAAGFGQRRTEVTTIVRETLPRSLGLLAVSLGAATLIGLLLGSLAAGRGTARNQALPIILFSLVGISLPSFFLAMMLQIGVIWLTRTTGRTMIPVGGFGWDLHLLLPALVLAARPIAQITRMSYVSLTDIWRKDFVRTASSKGLSDALLWARHIWPNVAIPILTTVGVALRFSLSSLPVVELFFGWAGIGQVLLRAIARRDDLLTVALALSLGLIFIVVNFFLEASYRLIDPRLREKAAQARMSRPQKLKDTITDSLTGLLDWLRDWPLIRRLRPKSKAEQAYEDRIRPAARHGKQDLDAHIRRARRKSWLRATLGSLPFVVGLCLLIGLLVLYVAGPALAPNNPYNTKGIATIEGEITTPPFAPSETFPWGSDALGRDVQSLVFSGAQQTLALIALTMLARLAVGFVLGVLAGWQQDRLLDRAIMSINEVFAALPTLIFAMILILALGIRRGMWVFVVALCFVGWGETMQFIRSEVIVFRKQLFVVSATALGARLTGIVSRHLLPNLLPALISLAALEMGAVAMLLGELGFIGIFIGGGTFAEVTIGGPPYHYSDVPEWGALLSNVRTYARGYPWTALPPALAFFAAILAFNLFGEGLRRLVQDVGLSFNRIINTYTLAGLIILIFTLRWAEANTGQTVFLKEQARQFSRQEVMAHFNTLTGPQMEARALGTAGADQAADYIVAKFKEYGLQPGGQRSTYFFEVKRDFFTLSKSPQLAANGRPLIYREDYAEMPTTYFNASASKSGELVVLLAGDQVFGNASFSGRNFNEAIQDLDLSDKAVLLLDNGGPLPNTPRQGTFYMTRNPDNLTRRFSLSAYSPQAPAYIPMQGSPLFYISEQGVGKLLAGTNISLDNLLETEQALESNEVMVVNTGVQVESSMPGEVQEKVPARHVIGYWPGHDEQLDENLIVVLAQYDGLGRGADGQLYPAANESASGLSVMLELLRSWHEAGFQPKKTIIFVAYVGEGFDNRQLPSRIPDVERFISAKFGFAANFTPEAFVFLSGAGAGAGNNLALRAGGNLRLAQHFETAAALMGVDAQRANEPVNLDAIFGGAALLPAEAAPTIYIHWAGSEELANTPADTPQAVEPRKLEEAGQAVSMALGIMVREINY